MSLTHSAYNTKNAFQQVGSSAPVSASASSKPCTCGNGKVKLWGPGGPHTALLPAAAIFNEGQPAHSQVEVCFGPEAKWRPQALSCAAGLYTAAEQQMAGFLRTYNEIISGSSVYPVTMHAAVLVVPAAN